jgi:hypothetical protein
MNQDKWQLIMATPVPMEPRSMPAVNSNGTDTARQLKAALWQAGHITLSLNELKQLVD